MSVSRPNGKRQAEEGQVSREYPSFQLTESARCHSSLGYNTAYVRISYARDKDATSLIISRVFDVLASLMDVRRCKYPQKETYMTYYSWLSLCTRSDAKNQHQPIHSAESFRPFPWDYRTPMWVCSAMENFVHSSSILGCGQELGEGAERIEASSRLMVDMFRRNDVTKIITGRMQCARGGKQNPPLMAASLLIVICMAVLPLSPNCR